MRKPASKSVSKSAPRALNRHPLVEKYLARKDGWIPQVFYDHSRRVPGSSKAGLTRFRVGQNHLQQDAYFNVIKGHADGRFDYRFTTGGTKATGRVLPAKLQDVELEYELKLEHWLPLADSHRGAEESIEASKSAWKQFMTEAAFEAVPEDKKTILLNSKQKKTAANKRRNRCIVAGDDDEWLEQDSDDDESDRGDYIDEWMADDDSDDELALEEDMEDDIDELLGDGSPGGDGRDLKNNINVEEADTDEGESLWRKRYPDLTDPATIWMAFDATEMDIDDQHSWAFAKVVAAIQELQIGPSSDAPPIEVLQDVWHEARGMNVYCSNTTAWMSWYDPKPKRSAPPAVVGGQLPFRARNSELTTSGMGTAPSTSDPIDDATAVNAIVAMGRISRSIADGTAPPQVEDGLRFFFRGFNAYSEKTEAWLAKEFPSVKG